MKARNLPAMIARKPRLELESLARSYTKTAIRTLAGIMNEEGMAPLARLAAAKNSTRTRLGPAPACRNPYAGQRLLAAVHEGRP